MELKPIKILKWNALTSYDETTHLHIITLNGEGGAIICHEDYDTAVENFIEAMHLAELVKTCSEKYKQIIDKKITSHDIKHLEFIYNRMYHVHNENPNYDYMIKFDSIIQKLKLN